MTQYSTIQHNKIKHDYHVVSFLNGHGDCSPIVGFTKVDSEPGTIYSFRNAHTDEIPEGLKFYKEQDALIVEHNGKKMVALEGFFLHIENPATFIVDRADGETKSMITIDSTIVDENGREHVIPTELLLVADSELTTTSPVAVAEPEIVAEESNFFADNWGWFALGGVMALWALTSDSDSSKTSEPDRLKFISLSDDTGSNTSDFITKIASQTITATLSTALVDGDAFYGSVDGGTTWTDITDKVTDGTAVSWDGVTLNKGIDGENSIVFKVTDLEGNDGANLGPQNYVLDTTVPTQTVSNVELSDDSGSSSLDFITNQPSQTIIATLSSALVTGYILSGSVDSGTTWTDITDKVTAGTAVSWDGVTLIDGKNSIAFKITNLAGNEGVNTGLQSYVLDTAIPTQVVSNVELSDDSGSSNSDFITNQASQTIIATLSGELVTGDILSGSVDGGTTWTDITDKVTAGTAVSWDGVTLVDGKNSIAFKITNLAGNDSANTGWQNYELDTTVPTQTVSNTQLSDDLGSNSDFITNQASQTITATLSSVLTTGDILSGSVDGGTTWTDITDKVTAGIAISWDGVTLIGGKNSIVFKITDLADNDSTNTGLRNYELGTDTPTQIIINVGLSDDSGSSSSDFITNQASQIITATLSSALVPGEILYGSVDGGTTWINITGKATDTAISWDGVTLIDGKNSIAFKITNLAGNEGVNTGLQSYVLDTAIPTQTVSNVELSDDSGSSSLDFITNQPFQTIIATLSSALVTGDILSGSVDGGTTWIDITGKVTAGIAVSWDGVTLVDGKNLISFKITNLAGNDGVNTGWQNYELDTTAPVQTVINVGLSDDLGSSNSDFITNQVSQTITATLSGVLATGDIFSGSVDGGTTWTDITGKVTAGTAISWDGVTLIEGKNSIVFKITDLADNDSANIGLQNYELDTAAPTQIIINVGLSDDSGSSSSDFITNQASQTITATLSSALVTGDVLYGSVDGGTTWTDITDKVTGTAINWDGATLIEGENLIFFQVRDGEGNDSVETGSQNYVLDTTVPTQAVSNVELSDDSGSSNSDFITNQASQTIIATLSGELVTGDILSGSVDGGTTWTDITDKVTAGTAVSWDGVMLVDGKNLIAFKITNLAGNDGANIGWQNYELDTIAPVQTVINVGLSDDLGSSNSDFITNQVSQTITATLSGVLATGDILSGSVDGGTTWTDITGKVTAGTAISWDGVTLIEGKNSIVFKITDLADNDSANIGLQSYELDTAAPTQIIINVGLSDDSGSSGSDFITNQASQTITATLSSVLVTGDMLYGSVDGGTTWTDITDKVTGTAINWDGATLIEGENLIFFKVRDGEGNDSVETGSQNYVLDITEPAQVVYDVGLSDDSGSSDRDFITKIISQTITAKLSVILVTGDILYGSVDGGGSWIDITDKVTDKEISWDGVTLNKGTDGKNSIVFKIENLAGNEGINTGSQIYVLDTTTPTQTVDSVAISDDTGSSTSDLVTKTVSQTITAKLSAVLVTDEELLYGSIDGGIIWEDITDKATGTAISWTRDLREGENLIIFQVRDLAGNEGVTSISIDCRLDTVAPTQTVDSVAISEDTGSSASDFITNIAPQTIAAKLSATLAEGDILYGSVDGGTTWTDITDKVTDTIISWDGVILNNGVDGNSSIVFKVTNLAGNTGTNTGSQIYVLDTIGPTQAVGNIVITSDVGISGRDFITSTISQTIMAELSSPLITDEILYGSVDSGKNWIDITDKVVGTIISWYDVSLVEGINSIIIKVSDLAGNNNVNVAQQDYILDTSVPTVVITSDTVDTVTGAVTYTFKFSEKVFGFTTNSIEVTGGTKGILTGPLLGDNAYTLTVTPPLGSNTPITAKVKAGIVTDTAGNAVVATEEVNTSIVVFDLTTGKVSTHSGKKFTAEITDIYIIVHANAKSVLLNSEFMWTGSANLTEAVKIHLVSESGDSILGHKSKQITMVEDNRYENRDIYFKTGKGSSYAALVTYLGNFQRVYNGEVSKVKLWTEPFLLAPGTFGGSIGAGVMTSQGLI